MVRAAALGVLLAGCVSSLPTGVITCDSNAPGACPTGWQCVNNVCWAPGTPPDGGGTTGGSSTGTTTGTGATTTTGASTSTTTSTTTSTSTGASTGASTATT